MVVSMLLATAVMVKCLTISSTLIAQGTVTRVDVTSNTLNVFNSPITRSGTINIEIPNDIVISGVLSSDTLLITSNANIYGNLAVSNIAATGKTGNELLGSVKETTRLAVLVGW